MSSKTKNFIQGMIQNIPKNQSLMIYGCYGYSVGLALEFAMKDWKIPPKSIILAGRNQNKVNQFIKSKLKMKPSDFRAVQIFNVNQAKEYLKKTQPKVVLNGAGPFKFTAKPMIEACTDLGIHYIDITGEIGVFEHALSPEVNKKAIKNGCVVCSGTGYDVVPSDCLGLHVATKFRQSFGEEPDCVSIGMNFMEKNPASHGTSKTMVVGMAEQSSPTRLNHKLQPLPFAGLVREFEFSKESYPKGGRKRMGASIPWGDCSTMYYTLDKKVPNIHIYATGLTGSKLTTSIMQSSLFSWSVWLWFKIPFTLWFAQKMVEWMIPKGPNQKHRNKIRLEMIGVAESKDKKKLRQARLFLPEAYKLTAETCMACGLALLTDAHGGKTGSQTPSKLFGKDFILNFSDVKRSEL